MQIDWSQEFFPYKTDPQENGWNLYFAPINLNQKRQIPDIASPEEKIIEVCGSPYHEIHDFLCIDQWINYERYLPYRLKVHELIKNHLKIHEPITTQVKEIFNEKMAGAYCIGVHVRYGSDHGSEAPKGTPSLEDYIAEVKNLIPSHPSVPVRVYLATDSHFVVKAFEQAFSPETLITINTCRTAYRDVPHLIYGHGDYWLAHPAEFHKKKPGYVGGVGVLMDALLLAHCHVLVHSTSNVASFITFYNPYIQSVYLPKNSLTWPCRHEKKG